MYVKIILKLMSHNVLRRFNYTEASKKVTSNGGFFNAAKNIGGGGKGFKLNIRVEA